MRQTYTPLTIAHIKENQTIPHEASEISIMPNGALVAVVLVLWLGIIGISVFIAQGNSQQSKILGTSTKKSSEAQQTKVLLEKVGSIYELPKGEAPTVATVSDKSKLQKQSFFMKAENGDKVIIYSKAKKAILYRPSTHIIIEIAPLAIEEN